jgi:hypothetical protein
MSARRRVTSSQSCAFLACSARFSLSAASSAAASAPLSAVSVSARPVGVPGLADGVRLRRCALAPSELRMLVLPTVVRGSGDSGGDGDWNCSVVPSSTNGSTRRAVRCGDRNSLSLRMLLRRCTLCESLGESVVVCCTAGDALVCALTNSGVAGSDTVAVVSAGASLLSLFTNSSFDKRWSSAMFNVSTRKRAQSRFDS